MHSKIKVWDIPFCQLTKVDILKLLANYFGSNRQYQITTPNPEFLLESLKNHEFKKLLQKTELNLPDGIGILWAATVEWKVSKVRKVFKVKGHVIIYIYGLFYLFCLFIYPKAIKRIIPERITGTDMMKEFFIHFPDKKIFLLGAAEGVAEKAGEKLLKECHPELVSGSQSKKSKIPDHVRNDTIMCFSSSPRPEDEKEILEKINEFQPEILLVAYGAPAQDLWIDKNLPKLKTVKVAMGVGGAFDFWAGIKPRAPKIFQKLGIEWLFRLIIEPQRWKRIFNAVIVFPWKFLRNI